MKKFYVCVPVTVFVTKIIEAQDEYEAAEKTEDHDFGLYLSPSLGGTVGKNDRDATLDVGEPDYDNIEVIENGSP